VLKELGDLKLRCQHGGTYDDPVTGKSREFDIRALNQVQPRNPTKQHSLGDDFPTRARLQPQTKPRRVARHQHSILCGMPRQPAVVQERSKLLALREAERLPHGITGGSTRQSDAAKR
jgi:hypothetical protein